jgi:hypothetical protein
VITVFEPDEIAAGLIGGFNLLLPDQHPQPVRSDEPIA